MSYNVYLESSPCGACGRKGEEPTCPDPTYNLAGIFHLALTGNKLPDPNAGTLADVVLHEPRVSPEPCGLEVLSGKTGAETLGMLDVAIARISNLDMRASFEALEPPNKWGTVEGGAQVLEMLRNLAAEYPSNRWRVR